jgi:crossover junction endodeoxyribonuclease RuvC
MVILGLDPGLATLGYGVIKKEPRKKAEMLDYGVISTPKDENLAVRLCMISVMR